MSKATADTLLGLGTGAFGIFLVIASREYSDLGAAFPRAVGISLIVLGAILAASVLWHRTRGSFATLVGSRARRALFVTAVALWGVSLPWFGFVAASAFGIAAVTIISNFARWDARRVALHLVGHAIILTAFYVLLAYGLQVPLPKSGLF